MFYLSTCKMHASDKLMSKVNTFYLRIPRSRTHWNWSHSWHWILTDISIDNSSLMLCKLCLMCVRSCHRILSCGWHRCWCGHFQLWPNNFLARCKTQNETNKCNLTGKYCTNKNANFAKITKICKNFMKLEKITCAWPAVYCNWTCISLILFVHQRYNSKKHFCNFL